MPTLTVSILCTYCTHFNTFTLRPTLTGRELIGRGHLRAPQLPTLRVVGADSDQLLDLRSVTVDSLRNGGPHVDLLLCRTMLRSSGRGLRQGLRHLLHDGAQRILQRHGQGFQFRPVQEPAEFARGSGFQGEGVTVRAGGDAIQSRVVDCTFPERRLGAWRHSPRWRPATAVDGVCRDLSGCWAEGHSHLTAGRG